MHITATFTFSNLEELYQFTKRTFGNTAPTEHVSSIAIVDIPAAVRDSAEIRDVPVAVRKKPGPKPKTSSVADVNAELVASVDAELGSPVTLVEPSVAPTSVEDCRVAIQAVVDKFGLVTARRLLAAFKVKRIPELTPDQYAAFVKGCTSTMA